jgi:hypothetical protein
VATFADKAYRDASPVVAVPYYGRNLPTRMREVNTHTSQGLGHRRTRDRHPQDLEIPYQAALLQTTSHPLQLIEEQHESG